MNAKLQQKFNLDTFDQIVLMVIVGVLLAMAAVILIGNNIGVQVESYSPENIARSDAAVRIRFYDEMAQSSVENHFNIEPALDGNLRWNGNREMIFEPTAKLITGQTYTVTLEEGAAADGGGAKLKEDFQFSFWVALPRVIYLAPATAQDRNLYAHDLESGEITQLTDTKLGIADYAISYDGQYVAYTAYNEDGTSDIWVLEVATQFTRQITSCVDAYCAAPAWKPDGTQIAYEREEYDTVFGQVGSRRVWTVDLATARSGLLFTDTQIIGHSPHYSPDGKRVAMFDVDIPGIMIYDLEEQSRVTIESMEGIVGDFSPDGTKLVYPVLIRGAIGNSFYTHLEMVDLEKGVRSRMSGAPEAPLEDRQAFWSPDGQTLAVTRRYFDTRGTTGTQVYLIDVETGAETPLIVDPNYTHGWLAWSPDGSWLVMQRFNQAAPNSFPEIWAYSIATGELQMLSENGMFPGFLP